MEYRENRALGHSSIDGRLPNLSNLLSMSGGRIRDPGSGSKYPGSLSQCKQQTTPFVVPLDGSYVPQGMMET